jgi:Rrf2 family transcriptional regulator, iron-sulfur cluster assembly transcription factor
MHLSRRARYALCGIFDLAYNGAGEPVRVQAVGERQGIPYRFLEQIFQALRKADLIAGKRGPGGGYVLIRRPEEITLKEVVEAVEGPISESRLSDVSDWPHSRHRPDFLWADLSEQMAGVLGRILVSDLCREAVRRSIDRELPPSIDYQI